MNCCTNFEARFNSLPVVSDTTIAEYIWIGGSGQDIRSKTMCIPKICTELEDFPVWNFDGSSTKQAPTKESEILLRPVYFCKDPFRGFEDEDGKEATNCIAYLVLCETLDLNLNPAKANFRHNAEQIFKAADSEEPIFGFEQEYILMHYEGSFMTRPLGFPYGGFAAPQGPYYCSIGSSKAIGRYVAEAHLKCCLYAGLPISGCSAEIFPGQWKFQLGPVKDLVGCDQLWVARYILKRLCEEFKIEVSFEPKQEKGDWNGSGCHTKFSFNSTRKEGGYERIIQCMHELSKVHRTFVAVYGEGNEDRLTGEHETASLEKFKYSIANRRSSIRIPTKTASEKKGYFEDRRPGANCDPYIVGGMLIDTTILKGKYRDEILNAYERLSS